MNDCKNRTLCIINKSDGSLVKGKKKVLFQCLEEKLFAVTKCITYKQNTCPVDTWLLIFKTMLLVLKMYNGTTQNAATKFTSFNQKGSF